MLTVDNVVDFLLDRRLIDAGWMIDGPLSIRSVARKNRNLEIVGPGMTGFLIKQPFDPADRGHETLAREAMFHGFCREEPATATMARVLPRLLDCDLDEAILVFERIPGVVTLLSQLEDPRAWGMLIEAVQAFGECSGRSTGSFERSTWTIPACPGCPGRSPERWNWTGRWPAGAGPSAGPIANSCATPR